MPRKRFQRLMFCLFTVAALCVIGRNFYRRYTNAQLFGAIDAQDAERVRSLLNRGTDVNATQNATPALLYAMNRLPSPITENAPAVNTPGQPEAIPLRQNVSFNSEAIACLLLERHADMRMPNIVGRDGRESVSSYDTSGYVKQACRHGSIPVLRCVLNRGVAPTPQCLDEALDYFSLYANRMATLAGSRAPVSADAATAKMDQLERARQAKRQEVSRQMVQMLREHGLRPTLAQCVKLNDVTTLKAELEAGVPPNPQPSENESPLTLAAMAGSPEMVKLLLAHGADPNIHVRNGSSALNIAVLHGNLELVKLLLAKGANVNGGKYSTALEEAVWGRHLAIVRLLLAKGADPRFTFTSGQYSLLPGAITLLPEIVPDLLQRGVDVNASNGAALIAALRSRRIALVRELLRRGVHVNPRPVSPAGAAGASLAAPAADSVRKIADAPDPNHPGRNIPQPSSPLLNAILYAPEAEAMLLKAGANIGPDKTAILAALAKCGRADLFARVLELGADVNSVDEDGETALTRTVRTAPSGVAILLAHGANPNVVTKTQRTPLDMAAGAGDAACAPASGAWRKCKSASATRAYAFVLGAQKQQ